MCEHEATAIARLGALPAEALKNRLSDLRAADFMNDVVAGRPRLSLVSGVECFQFDLADRYVLTVTANHLPPRSLATATASLQAERCAKEKSSEVGTGEDFYGTTSPVRAVISQLMGFNVSGYVSLYTHDQTSIFAALNALVSINSLRGSTSSPISIVNTLSAAIASSI